MCVRVAVCVDTSIIHCRLFPYADVWVCVGLFMVAFACVFVFVCRIFTDHKAVDVHVATLSCCVQKPQCHCGAPQGSIQGPLKFSKSIHASSCLGKKKHTFVICFTLH